MKNSLTKYHDETRSFNVIYRFLGNRHDNGLCKKHSSKKMVSSRNIQIWNFTMLYHIMLHLQNITLNDQLHNISLSQLEKN
jgi:hypothetical protein